MRTYSIPKNNQKTGLKPIDIVLGLFIAFGIYLRFLWGSDFIYTLFTDRDLLRGLNLWQDFQYLGAESMYHLARTPGGFMAYFFNLVQQIHPSANFIHTVVVLMDCVGLVLIPVLFARFLGRTPALFVAALYGATLVVLEELWKFWNPSMTPLFAVLIYWLVLSYAEDGRRYRLPAAFALIGLAAQFHLSFIILVPLIAVFLMIASRWPPISVIGLSFGAFLLTLLPYIVNDAANGFFNTQHLLVAPELDPDIWWQDKTGATSKYSWERLLLAMIRITGGRTFPEESAPDLIAGNFLLYWGATIVFNVGFVALGLWTGLSAWRAVQGKRVRMLENFGRVEWGLLVLFLIATVIAAKTVNNNQGRYHLSIIMPGLLLMGVGCRNFLHQYTAQHQAAVARLIPLGLLVILSAKYLAIAYYYNISPRSSNSSYAISKQIVDILKKDFGWTNEDIDFKVAFWVYGGRYPTRSIFTNEVYALNYIARATPDAEGVKRYDGCALVQVHGLRNRPPPEDPAPILAAIPYLKKFKIEKAVTRGDVRVIGYRYANRNCPRTFGNAYVLTPTERMADRIVAMLPAGQSREVALPNGDRRFVTRLPNSHPVAVDIASNGGRLEAVIHANSLRGWAASFRIERASIKDFAIRFTPLDGGTPVEVAETLPLGRNGLYTPWKMNPISLPPGQYSVEMLIGSMTARRTMARKSWVVELGPHEVRLIGSFSWP